MVEVTFQKMLLIYGKLVSLKQCTYSHKCPVHASPKRIAIPYSPPATSQSEKYFQHLFMQANNSGFEKLNKEGGKKSNNAPKNFKASII